MKEKINKGEIKKIILKEIVLVEALLQEYEEMIKPIAPDCSIDEKFRREEMETKQAAKAGYNKARERLSELRSALGRVDDSDFGRCAGCGGEIPAGRIVRMPGSRFCVACSSKE